MAVISKVWFSNSLHKTVAQPLAVKLLSHECHRISPKVNIGSGNGLVPSGNKPLLTTRSHCWSQYWTSYMTQYGITRPQWVKYIFVFSKGEFQPTLSRNYQIYSYIKYFTNAGSVPWLVIIFLRTETPEIRKVTPMYWLFIGEQIWINQIMLYISQSCIVHAAIGYVILVAIIGTTKQVPYQLVKSLQLIRRWCTRRWNLRVHDLQMSCCDLTRMRGYHNSSPNNGH